jgi:hypothetical protein
MAIIMFSASKLARETIKLKMSWRRKSHECKKNECYAAHDANRS